MLESRNLSVFYGRHRAVENVSVKVSAGEIVVMLGANGAGKSTFLRAIAGQAKAAAGGTVLMDGVDITHWPAHEIVEAGIALVPEDRGVFADLTVQENLVLGAHPRRARAREAENMERVLSLFPRLAERRRQLVRTMSGGERQMVAVGRAMMSAPSILMLDEPSLGLSPLLCRDLFRTLARIKDAGVGIFLVEQNAKQSLAIADRGYLLDNGHIVGSDTAEALSKDETVKKAYLGGGSATRSVTRGADIVYNDTTAERQGRETMAQQLRFNCMHFMPYAHLPENHKDYKSVWVNLSNKHYEPEKGHALYQRYLAELVLADQLGFDAVVVNEHHNTIYSMMATPNLIAAALVPQTKRAKICVWGTPPNLMLPNRLAEEYAILDVMSNGRLEVAFPLGTGMEYWANPVNPATARDKFRESLKIILQAWTADGPTTHYGTHYTYRFLNPWPRPMQRPHPPCYIVGTGSPETIDIAAEYGFGYASVFVSQERSRELNENLRKRAKDFGNTIRPDQLPILTFVYVAESDERARQEYLPHLQSFFENYLRSTPQYLAPPGYLSVEQLKIRAAGADKMHGGFDFDLLSKTFFIAVGSPEKVANQLGSWAEWMGSSHINAVMHVADMPHWKTVKNLSLFAEAVIPRLRKGAPQQIAAE